MKFVCTHKFRHTVAKGDMICSYEGMQSITIINATSSFSHDCLKTPYNEFSHKTLSNISRM